MKLGVVVLVFWTLKCCEPALGKKERDFFSESALSFAEFLLDFVINGATVVRDSVSPVCMILFFDFL